MIELRPNSSVIPSNHSNSRHNGAGGPRGAYQQMQYDVACYEATALAGEWIEDWFTSLPGRIASYFYSKLPSLPTAHASKVCDETPVCKTPVGSHNTTCTPATVRYLPEEGECEATMRCETMYLGLPLKQTTIRYAPGVTVSVQNRNGTGEATASDDTVENAFTRIAKKTGGLVTPSPSPKDFTPVIKKVFDKILEDSATSESLDVAFVLDTTGSMGPYIREVQDNLVNFLGQLRRKKDTRVAILEYRDGNDLSSSFVNRVNTPFTKDLELVEKGVRGLTVDGGGDDPEAVLDALLAAKNSLSWDPKAKRVVLLVGDQPPHPKTQDGRHDESEVVAQYTAAKTRIAVYPVLAYHEVTKI